MRWFGGRLSFGYLGMAVMIALEIFAPFVLVLVICAGIIIGYR